MISNEIIDYIWDLRDSSSFHFTDESHCLVIFCCVVGSISAEWISEEIPLTSNVKVD